MNVAAFDLLDREVQKAIWNMGWKELHPIQAEAIRQIVQGNSNLLITAQTAGGKTEAAFLPIISEIAKAPQPSIQALYIGPLKALINDQFDRLEKLCESLNIPVHRWHGDVNDSQKKALRKTPSGILLITPESLESNFINFGNQVPRIYRHLRFVVIDELHSFLENVRGIHLQSLLARLKIAIEHQPRIIGLSATIGEPDIACRYICPDLSKTVRINDPNSSREIRLGIRTIIRRPDSSKSKLLEPRLRASEVYALSQKLDQSTLLRKKPLCKENAPELIPTFLTNEGPENEDLAEIAKDLVKNFSQSTNLVFANSKATIESLADQINKQISKGQYNPFVVHHGSLSKELREAAEYRLKTTKSTTAICSSTLEMGIDIGSVRSVGQIDPPWSIAAMVQRLGRSGRREGESAILRMYLRENSPSLQSDLSDLLQIHLLRSVAMIRLMLRKWLEPPKTDLLHLSTLIHQILSCLKQTGGMKAAQLQQLLIQNGPFKNVDLHIFTGVLHELGAKEIIEQIPTGEIILAPLGEKITSAYDFYAAFQSTDEYTLLFGEEVIGQLPSDLIPPPGELILFSGRRWCVQSIDIDQKKVYLIPTDKGQPPKFRGSGGPIHPKVIAEMRQVLLDTDEPVWLDSESQLLLKSARYIAKVSGLLHQEVLIKEDSIQWFPWIGTQGLLALKAFAAQAEIRNQMDDISITYQKKTPQDFQEHLQSIINTKTQTEELARAIDLHTGEKFEYLLPKELLYYANGRDQLDLKLAQNAASRALNQMSSQK